MEAIKTTGTYDLNIFDYSNATYAAPSQIHVIRCEPVSVIDSVLINMGYPMSSFSVHMILLRHAESVNTAACNSLYTE